jgi:hypothetical protein
MEGPNWPKQALFGNKTAFLGVPIQFYWKNGKSPLILHIFSIGNRIETTGNLGGVCGFPGVSNRFFNRNFRRIPDFLPFLSIKMGFNTRVAFFSAGKCTWDPIFEPQK